MSNKGKLDVLKKNDKYAIVYIDKGEQLDLSGLDSELFSFDDYDKAKDYVKNHKDDLNDLVNKVLAAMQKDAEEKETAEKARKEAERAEWIAIGEAKKTKKEAKEKKKQERKEKRKKILSQWKGFVAGFLAAVITLVSGHFVAKGISSCINSDKTEVSGDMSKEEPEDDNSYNSDVDNIIEQEEELTAENFTKLTADFSKMYIDNNVNVTTEDLVKFVSIVNIDKLVEENKAFARELFSNQAKEEYLGDAAKVIGMTYTYNRNVFEAEGSTKNFIRISNAVSGPQKKLLQEVESYVDKIALVRDNAEETNKLIAELLQKLGDPTNELSYLDDGVGFGMQVCIELIRSYLAKDVINQENLDMLSILTSSEEYVANIYVTYDGCIVVYTRARTKNI